MRKLLFWFFLALISLSCLAKDPEDCRLDTDPTPVGSVEKYTVVIHDTVPANKVAGIVDAAAEWINTTKGHVTYEIVYSHFDIKAQPPIGEVWVYLGPPDPEGKYIGMAIWWNTDVKGHPGRSRIWIDSTLSDHVNFLVALHELGHALGLPHSNEAKQPSIMISYIIDVGTKPTCYDHQSVCKLWGCDQSCDQ